MTAASMTGAKQRVPPSRGRTLQQERIRVLQFITIFAPGGTEGQVVNLARGLDPIRFQSHFGCLYRWGELLTQVVEQGIPVAEYQINNHYNARAWWRRVQFLRDLRRQRIHLVHAYNFDPNVFAVPAARLSGAAVVASVRSTHDNLTPLQQRAQRLACRMAHRIAVNAEAVRQTLIAQGYDSERIVVIRNGVNLSRFQGPRQPGQLRHEFGLPAHAPLVAAVARLIPLKGLEYFLQAAALVVRRVPDVHFLIVGDQYLPAGLGKVARDVAYRNKLERTAQGLGLDGRVVFTGLREDVPAILSEVAVSVLPSVRGEGLSNALLEAMAAQVPVVATNVGGNGEAVEDGVTGLLVPPQDAEALARAICLLLERRDLATRFGEAGRDRITRAFSLERCVRETERLYLDVLEETGRHPLGPPDPPL